MLQATVNTAFILEKNKKILLVKGKKIEEYNLETGKYIKTINGIISKDKMKKTPSLPFYFL